MIKLKFEQLKYLNRSDTKNCVEYYYGQAVLEIFKLYLSNILFSYSKFITLVFLS